MPLKSWKKRKLLKTPMPLQTDSPPALFILPPKEKILLLAPKSALPPTKITSQDPSSQKVKHSEGLFFPFPSPILGMKATKI